jgi:MoaA/NifB/PqqE/SkfB family radical SAM enzyme
VNNRTRELKELDLQVTNRCPLTCKHCCCSSGPSGEEPLSTAFIVRLLEEAASLGVKEVHLTGGEPLIRNDIFDIIAEARQRGLYVQLQSSGAILNSRICAKLRELQLDLFMISLDGLEVTHDRYRGRGSFQRALSAIHDLQCVWPAPQELLQVL